MKTTIRMSVLMLSALVLAGLLGGSAMAKEPWEKIKIPELNAVEMPAYERVDLSNGMVLYLAEDHGLPLVELSATIRVGAIYDPADKLGLAGMTGRVMRTGGAGDRDGDAVDALVEDNALEVNSWCGMSAGGAYLSCLTEDVDLGLGLLADILVRPRFADDKIELAKQEQKAGISRRNDEPLQIAMREVPKALYGADHPLARHPEYDTIAAVTRDDMVTFHADYYGPDRTYLVVIGDFQTADMVRRIESTFANWQPAGEPLPADPEVPMRKPAVNIAAKDGLTQATVVLGHKGVRNDHPDYAALRVGAEILGGGFSSRLFKEIRSKQGLAYAVGSTPGTGWRFPGTFMAYTMTKNETAEKAAKAIMVEIKRMLAEPVTDDELQFAKDLILNSEVFSYDTKREVLDRMVIFDMYDYPVDFLQNYQEAVKNLTIDDVLAAVRNVWKPEDMSFLVVGTPDEFDGDFSSFGEVREIDITIPLPTPKLEIPAATPESLARGKQLMQDLRDGTGGKAYDQIKSYQKIQVMTIQSPVGAMDITIDMIVALPDRMRMATKLPFGEQVVVANGDKGWTSGLGQSKDLDADDITEIRGQFLADTLNLLRGLDNHEFQALDPTEVAGKLCNPVAVELNGETTVIFLDAETGLVAMTQAPAKSPMTQSPVTQKSYVNRYGEFDGVKLPDSLTITHDDEDFAEVTVESFMVNPKVDQALFAK